VVEYLNAHPVFVVLIISLVVWFGLFVYLFRMDRKIGKLEKEIDRKD
jgi:CcmD family protein